MKQSHRRGITLVELVIALGIIGTFSFLLPILVKLFNNMAYLQQKSVMEAEVKAVMWQLSKEVQNAPKVQVDLAPYAPWFHPGMACLQPGSGNCLAIYNYDYGHYSGNETYETPEMYMRKRPDVFGGFFENHVMIFYEVVQETTGNDYNKNNQIENKPYLLKRTVWNTPWTFPPLSGKDLGATWSWWPAGGSVLYETHFLGRIIKTNSPPTFASYGGQQLFKVTFSLKSSYDRKGEPPRYFSSILSMDSLQAW